MSDMEDDGPSSGGEQASDEEIDLGDEFDDAYDAAEPEQANSEDPSPAGKAGSRGGTVERREGQGFLAIAEDMMDDDYDADGYNPVRTGPADPFNTAGPSGPGMFTAGAFNDAPADDQLWMEDGAKRKEEIFNSLTEEQKDRYEAFMRASLPKPKIKRLMASVMGSQPTDKAVLAMQGIAKIHLGEIVETAREMARLEGYSGPLLPRHIRRAYTELHTQKKMPHFRGRKGRPLR